MLWWASGLGFRLLVLGDFKYARVVLIGARRNILKISGSANIAHRTPPKFVFQHVFQGGPSTLNPEPETLNPQPG